MVDEVLHPHENLGAWRKGMDLVTCFYQLAPQFPKEERFGIVAQIQRAAVSVPTNIAEGSARATSTDTRRFYVMARASLMELDTLIALSDQLSFISDGDSRRVRLLIIEVSKLLNALIKYQTDRAKGIYEPIGEFETASDP